MRNKVFKLGILLIMSSIVFSGCVGSSATTPAVKAKMAEHGLNKD